MLRNVSLGLFVVLAACGSARVIQRTQTGGVIELSGDQGKAMEQANSEMAAHCGPNNFTIVQEGQEAVGTDTYTQQNTQDTEHTSRSGRTTSDQQSTQGVTSTRTATVWRVHYQCGAPGAAPTAAGMAPAAAPPPGAPPPAAPPPGGAPPPPAY
jgi:hypothetical protein